MSSYFLALHRELKLIGLDRSAGVARVVSRLDHLALVGLEDEALAYNIVQLATLDTLAKDEVEAVIKEIFQTEKIASATVGPKRSALKI